MAFVEFYKRAAEVFVTNLNSQPFVDNMQGNENNKHEIRMNSNNITIYD